MEHKLRRDKVPLTLKDVAEIRAIVRECEAVSSRFRDNEVKVAYETQRSESLTEELISVRLGFAGARNTLAMVVAASTLPVLPPAKMNELAWLSAYAVTLIDGGPRSEVADAIREIVNNAIVLNGAHCPLCSANKVAAHAEWCPFRGPPAPSSVG